MRNLIKKSEKKEQPRRTYNWECKANGCTLPATRVTEWHDNLHGGRGDQRDGAPKAGCCGYHADNKPHNWQEVTSRVRKMLPLMNVLGELDQLSTVQLGELQPEEVPKYKGSKPLEGENMFQWMSRMRAKIDEFIVRGLPVDAEITARKNVDIKTLIRSAVG